jgi:hypothetical protein
MTTPHAQHDAVMDSPACTPGAVRAVLAAHAGADVLAAYDRDLDAAFEQARADGDLSPLVQTVRGWWFEADSWRDPEARRQFQDRVGRYLSQGPPPRADRLSREEIRARYGV